MTILQLIAPEVTASEVTAHKVPAPEVTVPDAIELSTHTAPYYL